MKREKKLNIEVEEIDAMGQESEKKAIPAVQEVMKGKEKKEEKIETDDLTKLHDKKRWTIKTYTRLLSELLIKRLLFVDWPDGWTYDVIPTDVGVILSMEYNGRYFRSGFKATGEEKYDLNAVNMYVVRAENTIDRVMQPVKEAGNGIIHT